MSDTIRGRLARKKAGQYWDRAIRHISSTLPRDTFVEDHWRSFLPDVDAILSELQDPTENMIRAMASLDEVPHMQRGTVCEIWRAGIKHIQEGGS